MYSIYFENRCIAVCSVCEKCPEDPNSVIYRYCPEFNPGKNISPKPKIEDIPSIFRSAKHISKLYIQSENEEQAFRMLCSRLTLIVAGGGLVTNRKGEYLLIFRHGKWDLPKGKQEQDEDICSSALREVEEECGLHELQIKEPICQTYHTYELNGKFMIKRTHWFKMSYTGNGLETSPQTEEDIEKAIWVKKEDLPSYLSNTYPSIREVFSISDL